MNADAATATVREHIHEVLRTFAPATADPQMVLGARFDAGLAWVWFPPGAGGLGLSRDLQALVDAEFAAAGAVPPDVTRNIIGHGMAAPTIGVHGTADQQRRWLRPLFTDQEIWCQLFSEPGGSDLAALARRAVRDGDEWIVNGQKVWTTFAHTARWGLLVARTDPDTPKHRGLTCFVVDMHAPGVDVRPLRQMTGEAEFNEVFLNEVRVPDTHRLGDEGDGWRVAMTTLMNERVAIGGGAPPRGSGPIGRAVEVWRSLGGGHPVLRDRLMQRWVEAEVNRLTNVRARQSQRAGTPGPEGSVAKLAMAELNQRIYELCIELISMDGTLYPEGYEMRRPERGSFSEGDVRQLFLRTRANTIEGGTSEIMSNILAERILGLPAEPRTDKHLPWNDVLR